MPQNGQTQFKNLAANASNIKWKMKFMEALWCFNKLIMKCIAFSNQGKSHERNMLSLVHQSSILSNISKNPWFTRFPSQIMQ